MFLSLSFLLFEVGKIIMCTLIRTLWALSEIMEAKCFLGHSECSGRPEVAVFY